MVNILSLKQFSTVGITGSLKILEKAMMWKQAMAGLNGGAGATGAGAGNEGADPSSSSLGKRRAEELGDSIDIDDI